MDKELLEILCCPQSRQDLHLAESAELSELNSAIGRGVVVDVQGRTVKRPVEAVLVRQDGKVGYPVRDGIPVLLTEDAMVLDGIR